jgi:hypothetical protein
MNLQEIPVLPRNGKPAVSSVPLAPSHSERAMKYEYEFSFRWPNGTPAFVHLWDTNDLSACQRASASHVTEINYSQETGNGFFTVDDATWCFKKEPYERTWGPHNEVSAEGEAPERTTKKPQTADDILASL